MTKQVAVDVACCCAGVVAVVVVVVTDVMFVVVAAAAVAVVGDVALALDDDIDVAVELMLLLPLL